MHVKLGIRYPRYSLYRIKTEGYIRHIYAVHNIEVEHIRSGGRCSAYLILKMKHIRGKHGRRDFNFLHSFLRKESKTFFIRRV